MVLTLAQIPPWMISLLAVVFLLVCIVLILIVLIQRPQGGGLSGAFGAGGGAGQTAFGTKTGDVLTLVTITLFVLFVLAAVGLNFAFRPPAAPSSTPTVLTPEAQQTQQATEREMQDMGVEAPVETPDPAQVPTQDPPPPGGDDTP